MTAWILWAALSSARAALVEAPRAPEPAPVLRGVLIAPVEAHRFLRAEPVPLESRPFQGSWSPHPAVRSEAPLRESRGLRFSRSASVTRPSGGEAASFRVVDRVLDAALSLDGGVAAWTDGRAAWFYDRRSDRVPGSLDAGMDRAEDIALVALPPDGSSLVTASYGRARTLLDAVKLDAARGRTLELPGRPGALAARRGQVAALDRDSNLSLWSPETGALSRLAVLGTTRGAPPIAYSHDGGRLAVATDQGRVHLFLVDKDEPHSVLLEQGLGAAPTALAWSARGRRLIAADAEGGIRIWDFHSYQTTALRAAGLAVQSVGWSEGAQALLWGTHDALWRAVLGERGAAVERAEYARRRADATRLDGAGAAVFSAFRSAERDQVVLRGLLGEARPAATPLALKRAELMEKLEVYEAERLVPRLGVYARDPLEIFRLAARKWLAELAELGDEQAAAALRGL